MPVTSDQNRWYLVHCKPRQDKRASENLERQGFHCYSPARRVEKLRYGRKQVLAEPLFPGYLFIRLDRVNDNWHPIRSTRGVNGIVRFNGDPLPVQDEVIEQIRARLEGAAAQEPYLQPGERVQITEVAFSRLEAIFLANDGEERVAVLLSLLQREQERTFPLSCVRKLK
jgi:transcriptional antiterminator RfaH